MLPMAPPTVLVVEDEPIIRGAFVDLLSADYDVVSAASLDEARTALATRHVDVVLLDWMYDDGATAAPLLGALAAAADAPAVVVVTVSKAGVAEAARYGVPVLLKPFDLDVLLSTLDSARRRNIRPSTP